VYSYDVNIMGGS